MAGALADIGAVTSAGRAAEWGTQTRYLFGMTYTWRDPDQFTVGSLYVSHQSDVTAEFVGVGEVHELARLKLSPVVLIFRDIYDSSFMWASTEQDYRDGETFEAFGDRAVEDLEQ